MGPESVYTEEIGMTVSEWPRRQTVPELVVVETSGKARTTRWRPMGPVISAVEKQTRNLRGFTYPLVQTRFSVTTTPMYTLVSIDEHTNKKNLLKSCVNVRADYGVSGN